jgi:hypothetical protein
LAIVSGFWTGLTMSVPCLNAVLIGDHPEACAPWIVK